MTRIRHHTSQGSFTSIQPLMPSSKFTTPPPASVRGNTAPSPWKQPSPGSASGERHGLGAARSPGVCPHLSPARRISLSLELRTAARGMPRYLDCFPAVPAADPRPTTHDPSRPLNPDFPASTNPPIALVPASSGPTAVSCPRTSAWNYTPSPRLGAHHPLPPPTAGSTTGRVLTTLRCIPPRRQYPIGMFCPFPSLG